MKNNIYWIIKTPNGIPLPFTFSSARCGSLNKYLAENGIYGGHEDWKQFYRRGYRCVKVKLAEVES